MDTSLHGKVAVVLGCSRMTGIGRATAREFSSAGASVAVTGTRRDPSTFPADEQKVGWKGIDSVREEVEARGVGGLAVPMDASSKEDIQELVQATHEKFGRIDIVVINFAAAIGGDATDLIDVPDDVWQKYIDINVNGVFHSLKAFGRYLVDQGQGGRIINMSTTMSKIQNPRTGPYASTKAMMNVLTHVMSKEMGPHNITVNAICPGPIPTPRATARSTESGATQLDRYSHLLSIKRLGTVDEIAAMALFLASPAAGWITGQTINVDGGMYPE